MMRPVIHALLLWLACTQAYAAGFDNDLWDRLLKEHVTILRGGQASQVDYAGMGRSRGQLASYLRATSAITQAEFDQWPGSEQLAFLINAYNAWTVQLILAAYPDLASIKDLGSLLTSPWTRSFIPLLGQTRSLDEIEHQLIRGSDRYGDPRIHFAVNCASIGCPALRAEAYLGARLDAQLEQQTRGFLSDRSRNGVDGDSLEVSPIFKWYREDFEQGWRNLHSLPDFLAAYAGSLGLSVSDVAAMKSGQLGIEFNDYDWSLNDLRRLRQ